MPSDRRQVASGLFLLTLGGLLGTWLSFLPVQIAVGVVCALSGLYLIVTTRTVDRWRRRLVHRPGHLPTGTYGILEMKVTRAKNSPQPDEFRFTTRGRMNVAFTVGYPPRALVFRKPDKAIVRANDLPPAAEVPCRRGRLRVERFTSDGFIVSEIDTVMDDVEVEVFV
jgi:hypothetical protein